MAKPLAKEVCPVIGVQVTQPHTITVPTKEAIPRLLIRRLLIRELAVPPRWDWNMGKAITSKQAYLTLIRTAKEKKQEIPYILSFCKLNYGKKVSICTAPPLRKRHQLLLKRNLCNEGI
ncbi:hypothetical protein AVEN_273054-1 [Araneus ventricosus]|uniref:Uncharacterized protein n=1 Tax=Araneus ventricosus TaxID=182803 RepID=A0A4Y2VGP5_ARAVE|nr:hypothetical protein AVEN_274538-1 [Araneus ventricosus]GBO24455.1 hypothetical protein AVEN_273054-1 [Araneus ventricosus]